MTNKQIGEYLNYCNLNIEMNKAKIKGLQELLRKTKRFGNMVTIVKEIKQLEDNIKWYTELLEG